MLELSSEVYEVERSRFPFSKGERVRLVDGGTHPEAGWSLVCHSERPTERVGIPSDLLVVTSRLNDIEIIREHEANISILWQDFKPREIFDYMKAHNLISSYAPWKWGISINPCNRCGGCKVHSFTEFRIIQCVSAARSYEENKELYNTPIAQPVPLDEEPLL